MRHLLLLLTLKLVLEVVSCVCTLVVDVVEPFYTCLVILEILIRLLVLKLRMATLRCLVVVVWILLVNSWILLRQCRIEILLVWISELTCAFVIQVKYLTVMLSIGVFASVTLMLFCRRLVALQTLQVVYRSLITFNRLRTFESVLNFVASVVVDIIQIFILSFILKIIQVLLLLWIWYWRSFLLESVLCILRFNLLLLLQPLSCILNLHFNSIKSLFLFFLIGFSLFLEHCFALDGLFQIALWVSFSWFYLQWKLKFVSWIAFSCWVNWVFVFNLLWRNTWCSSWNSFRCLFVQTQSILLL